LVGSSEPAGEAVRAISAGLARNATIGAGAVLAGKTGNAVVGIIATLLDAETAVNGLVACIGRVCAVLVVRAGAATGDEAARKVFASSGGMTDLTDGARVLEVAQGIRVGAGSADSTSVAPGATTIGLAAIDAAVDAAIYPAIRLTTIDTTLRKHDATIRIGRGIVARIVGRRRGGRLATAGRDRSGQQEVSKETHWLGGRSNPRPR
jgi:hypothetical protein